MPRPCLFHPPPTSTTMHLGEAKPLNENFENFTVWTKFLEKFRHHWWRHWLWKGRKWDPSLTIFGMHLFTQNFIWQLQLWAVIVQRMSNTDWSVKYEPRDLSTWNFAYHLIWSRSISAQNFKAKKNPVVPLFREEVNVYLILQTGQRS